MAGQAKVLRDVLPTSAFGYVGNPATVQLRDVTEFMVGDPSSLLRLTDRAWEICDCISHRPTANRFNERGERESKTPSVSLSDGDQTPSPLWDPVVRRVQHGCVEHVAEVIHLGREGRELPPFLKARNVLHDEYLGR